MKELIRKVLPKGLIPVTRSVYYSLFGVAEKIAFPRRKKESLAPLTSLKCVVSYNKHGGYCVPKSSRHRPAAQRILRNAVFEPRTIEFVVSHCGTGDIVHAGAYFGDFLPALSRGCAPNSIVWAFEPNRENYRCASITCQINALENVVLTNAGLGARNEAVSMRTVDKDGQPLGGGSRIIAGKTANEPGLEAIQVVALDSAVESEREISIIQLDVEGYEREALQGALRTIQRCLPIIIVEVLQDSSLLESDWFSENILSLGYRKKHVIHGNSVFLCGSRR
ncbi:hypothetical protein BH24PSE2_BH24PSE2_18980 [soil metagenome]